MRDFIITALCITAVVGCTQTQTQSAPRTKTVLVAPSYLANADNQKVEAAYRRQLSDCQDSSIRRLSGSVNNSQGRGKRSVVMAQQVYANPFGSMQQGYQQGRQLRLQQQQMYRNSGAYQRGLQREVFNNLVQVCMNTAEWRFEQRASTKGEFSHVVSCGGDGEPAC